MSTNTLIALVDGSVYSESVCHYAAWLAKRSDWTVKVYHVMGRREGMDKQDLSGAIRLGARTALLEQLSELDAERAKLTKDHGRAILEDAKALILQSGDLDVETRLRQGDLVETVTAKEDSGEMIVIGKRGEAAGQARAHLGSNLERIVRASHRPVFIANHDFKEIGSVLVAFDGGATAMKAVDYISRSKAFAGLKVTLAFAGKSTSEVQRNLDAAAATLKAGGITSDNRIEDIEPEKLLSQMTAEAGHELLVMGAYGHSRVRQLLIGSTTTAMIRSCRTPVLIMR